jgi:hypothetical protein
MAIAERLNTFQRELLRSGFEIKNIVVRVVNELPGPYVASIFRYSKTEQMRLEGLDTLESLLELGYVKQAHDDGKGRILYVLTQEGETVAKDIPAIDRT